MGNKGLIGNKYVGWARTRKSAGKAILVAFAGAAFIGAGALQADTIVTPQLNSFVLQNTTANGTVSIAADGLSFVLTGGNTGSGLSGETDFTGTSTAAGTISFDWSYSSLDQPGFDAAGYFLN